MSGSEDVVKLNSFALLNPAFDEESEHSCTVLKSEAKSRSREITLYHERDGMSSSVGNAARTNDKQSVASDDVKRSSVQSAEDNEICTTESAVRLHNKHDADNNTDPRDSCQQEAAEHRGEITPLSAGAGEVMPTKSVGDQPTDRTQVALSELSDHARTGQCKTTETAMSNGKLGRDGDGDRPKKSDTAPIVENEEREVAVVPESATVQPDVTISKTSAYVTIGTLLIINLLNYMDRFTISGVLLDVQDYYNIQNTEAGLIQTSFICTYMIFSPICGYLGDRYTRKYIMAAGIFMWSIFTLAASFIPGDKFYAFVMLRALVGIGEASYSTIAPTIIADLFAKEMRTKMLMVFYFAIPVGSGMGYIVGSYVAKLLGSWQWALRVTPGLGALCVVLILVFCREPPRGHSEGAVHLVNTPFKQDIIALVKNPSFMLSTGGFTCVAFVTGALAFWAPTYMIDSIKSQGMEADNAQVSTIFGVVTVGAGFLGVALGAETARRYKRINPRADPLICALGLLSCVPFLFVGLVCAQYNTIATWVLIFIGETMLCMNWAVVTDILLYVVVPTRRSTAEAFQILVSHAFGDAGSPYLIGQISDSLSHKYPGREGSPSVQFITMQYALYSTTFVCVLGGGFFLATAIFVERDKNKAERQTKGIPEDDDSDVAIQDHDGLPGGGDAKTADPAKDAAVQNMEPVV